MNAKLIRYLVDAGTSLQHAQAACEGNEYLSANIRRLGELVTATIRIAELYTELYGQLLKAVTQ